ncbi:hypothetical protein GEMRC1_000028 [Eukaryota sp. GEM-RC1]
MSYAAPKLPNFEVVWKIEDDRMGWFFRHKNVDDPKDLTAIVNLNLFDDFSNVKIDENDDGVYVSVPAPVTVPVIARSIKNTCKIVKTITKYGKKTCVISRNRLKQFWKS